MTFDRFVNQVNTGLNNEQTWISILLFDLHFVNDTQMKSYTLESGIDVGQGINVGPGKT